MVSERQVDYRDLVIMSLGDENLMLLERLAVAATYRDMANCALEQLAAQNRELQYLRRRNASLVDEVRMLRDADAAA